VALLVFDGGAGELFRPVFGAVGVAFQGHDLGVMDEAVDRGRDNDVVVEDLSPPY
jgi:hypothetical protein